MTDKQYRDRAITLGAASTTTRGSASGVGEGMGKFGRPGLSEA